MKKASKKLVSESVARFVAQHPSIRGLPVGIEEDETGNRILHVYADTMKRTKGLPDKWEGNLVVVRVVGKVRPL